MISRSNELTRGSARPLISSSAIRACVRLATVVGALLLLAVASQLSLAAPINYGSHMGATVTYVDVTEESATDPTPLYGAPTVTGDSIDFNPIGFDANSSGGGTDVTDGQLTFMVVAKPGYGIPRINFDEAGDTTLAGIVPLGSTNTGTVVVADGVIDIHEVDFVGINNISVPFALLFNPSNGDYYLGVDGGGGPFYHTQWTGSVSVNLLQALFDHGVRRVLGPTKISVNLDNALIAFSQPGTSALIAKKDFGGLSITVDQPGGGGGPDIPEPASLMLAGLGLIGMVLGRRFAQHV